jgi:hypothetical protein
MRVRTPMAEKNAGSGGPEGGSPRLGSGARIHFGRRA